MLEHHAAFETPEGSQQLWRYLDVGRYLALLSSSALHFTRVDLFEDKWEGEQTKPSQKKLELMDAKFAKMGVVGKVGGSKRWLKKTVFANCWHEADYESAAMWRLYGEERSNLAILTTIDKLNHALQAETHHTVYCGRVKYVDYKKDFIPISNTFTPFLRKRRSFAFEAEVRLLIWDYPLPKEGAETKIGFNSFGKHKAAGIDAKVTLSNLVEKVLVSPKAPDWYVSVIRDVTAKYGLPVSLVTRSTFDEGPLR